MVAFKHIARQIRTFNQGDTEVEVLGKEIEELMQQLTKLQEDQEEMKEIFASFKKHLFDIAEKEK